MTAELSCLKFLNAVANKLSMLYEFEQDDKEHATMNDVFRAIDSKNWNHRKIPRTTTGLDEFFHFNRWHVLKTLNAFVTVNLLHDTQLLRHEDRTPYIVLPSKFGGYDSDLNIVARKVGFLSAGLRIIVEKKSTS